MGEALEEDTNLQKYLTELADRLTSPAQKRLIQAYKGDNPKKSMEDELGKILIEVLRCED